MKEKERPFIEAEPDFAKSKSRRFMLKAQRVEQRRGRKCWIN